MSTECTFYRSKSKENWAEQGIRNGTMRLCGTQDQALLVPWGSLQISQAIQLVLDMQCCSHASNMFHTHSVVGGSAGTHLDVLGAEFGTQGHQQHMNVTLHRSHG